MKENLHDQKNKYLGKFILGMLLLVLLITVYTVILQENYRRTTLQEEVKRDSRCADAIHRVVSNKLTRDDIEKINHKADKQSVRYKKLQEELNEIRSLNSTRYLYTAKRNEKRRLIYQVDGLILMLVILRILERT